MVPTVLPLLKSRASSMEQTRKRCMSRSCPLRSQAAGLHYRCINVFQIEPNALLDSVLFQHCICKVFIVYHYPWACLLHHIRSFFWCLFQAYWSNLSSQGQSQSQSQFSAPHASCATGLMHESSFSLCAIVTWCVLVTWSAASGRISRAAKWPSRQCTGGNLAWWHRDSAVWHDGWWWRVSAAATGTSGHCLIDCKIDKRLSLGSTA